MSINRTNYEEYLMDYLDGKLDANGVSEVLLFLEQCPDIKDELDGIADLTIAGNTIENNPSFEHLKQKEFKQVKQEYEYLLISELEGNLSAEDKLVVEKGVLLYPELSGERALFASTVLQPDYSVTYPGKRTLKRGSMWVLHRNTMVRAAAILLLTASAGWFLMRNDLGPASQGLQTASVSEGVGPLSIDMKTPSSRALSDVQSIKVLDKANFQHSELHRTSSQQQSSSIIPKETPFAIVQELPLKAVEDILPEVHTKLKNVSGWLTYTQPKSSPPKDDRNYTDLKTLAGVGVNRGAQKLEAKTLSVFEAMNKTAGISMEKDEFTGRIKRFEIAGLGFEWSQSK
jgi:hypothetical protein